MYTKKTIIAFVAAAVSITTASSGLAWQALTAMAQTVAAAGSATSTAQGATSTAALQSQINANDAAISQLNQEIANYQQQIQQAGADKKTLQAAINALNLRKNEIEAQVAVTQRQIATTQLQIQQIGGQINQTQATIASDQAALAQYLVNLQKDENQPLFMQVLSSNDLSAAWSDVNATLQMQEAVANAMQTLKNQETALADSKNQSQQQQQTLTAQQQTLKSQQLNLTQTAQAKSQLLVQTSAKEANYEKLLAAAEAELNSFTAFTQNAGGSKLLGNQTVCDSWGCYYSQRDSAWGGDSLNGTKYTLASAGCLITAMAMVMTHYGYRNVTPVTINSNPANFAAYYPAYLLFTINVDGVSATRKKATIDQTLASGNPVIVGLRAYGGTHFVVLVSGKNGNYIMKDPYVINGNDVPFAAHYSMRDIYSVERVIVS
jgi:peptidoglycan hydrolase CwlO-like protein